MQHLRVPVDEAICFVLLRTCFNCIQISRNDVGWQVCNVLMMSLTSRAHV